jgi:hypothetical protein
MKAWIHYITWFFVCGIVAFIIFIISGLLALGGQDNDVDDYVMNPILATSSLIIGEECAIKPPTYMYPKYCFAPSYVFLFYGLIGIAGVFMVRSAIKLKQKFFSQPTQKS